MLLIACYLTEIIKHCFQKLLFFLYFFAIKLSIDVYRQTGVEEKLIEMDAFFFFVFF